MRKVASCIARLLIPSLYIDELSIGRGAPDFLPKVVGCGAGGPHGASELGGGGGGGRGLVALEAGGGGGTGAEGDRADQEGEGEGQGDAGAVAEAVGGAGHDGAADAGADGLAQDVEQLQARGGPALLTGPGQVQGGHRQRGVGLADAEPGHGPGHDAERGRHRRQQRDRHQDQAGEDQDFPQPDQAARAEPVDPAGLDPGPGRPGHGGRGQGQSAQAGGSVPDGGDGVRDVGVTGKERAGQQAPAQDRGGQAGPGDQGGGGRQTPQRQDQDQGHRP